MSGYPVKLAKTEDGSYTWTSSIDVDYYRKSVGVGFKYCIGMAVFLLVFGGAASYHYKSWTSFWAVTGSVGVFLLITCLVFGLTLLAVDPQDTYVLTETYVKTGSGKSSAYFTFKNAKTAICTRKYVELQGKLAKMRVYAPEEDFDFVRSFIMNRIPGDCEIRYE